MDNHVCSLSNMKANSTMSAQMLAGQMAGSAVRQLQTLMLTNCMVFAHKEVIPAFYLLTCHEMLLRKPSIELPGFLSATRCTPS